MFKLLKSKALQYYIIEEFQQTGLVNHAFSTRLGGVSEGSFESLNLGLHTGDDKEEVLKNRSIICNELNMNSSQIVAGEQIHSDQIKVVTKEDQGKGALSYESSISKTDALITAQIGVTLTSYYADCVPIIILDPEKKVVALAHGGWKGTVKKIAQKTVLRMKEEFASQVEKLLIGIGPSIGPCCYEVDDYVINFLRDAFNYWDELVVKVEEGKWKLNLWESNWRQLQDIGVLKENIIISGVCTSCNTDLLYSYRAEDGKTGRMASLIQLK
jgi:hypothetical protein